MEISCVSPATRTKTVSRSIFTHMIDVNLYHNSVPEQSAPSPLGEGTLHHIFDGGWVWVIPFNNFVGATNPLCSVGIQFDEQYPADDTPPQDEFDHWIAKMPSAASQFVNAKSVREWTKVNRLQFSSKRTTGDRFCILGHAAGFIDPLYSRGLVNTTEAINALAPLILQAFKADDFSAERFGYVETLQRNLLDNNDDMVRCSYLSWRDYDLWNAWFRLWAVAVMQGGLSLKTRLQRYAETHDKAFLPDAAAPSGFFLAEMPTPTLDTRISGSSGIGPLSKCTGWRKAWKAPAVSSSPSMTDFEEPSSCPHTSRCTILTAAMRRSPFLRRSFHNYPELSCPDFC